MSDGQAIMSHVGRCLWLLWWSHDPHRHLKRRNRAAFQPTSATTLAVGGCIFTGGVVSMCMYRRYKTVVRRDDVLGLDLPLSHIALTTKKLRIPRSRHGRYLEQNRIRE